MKRLVTIVCAVFVLSGLIPANMQAATLNPTGSAEAQASALPDRWETKQECIDTVMTGTPGVTYNFYEPKDRRPKAGVPAVDGKTYFHVVSLTSASCGKMLIEGNVRKYVAQRPKIVYRAYREKDGSMKIYARDDCSNPFEDIWFAPGPPGPQGPEGESSLTVVTQEPPGLKCHAGGQKIDVGRDTNRNDRLDASEVEQTSYVCNGVDGKPGSPGLTILPATTATAPAQPQGPSRWGVTFGGSGFSSAGMSEVVGGFFNRDACNIKGGCLDVGIAWRRSKDASWFARGTFSSCAISGTTSDTCANCPGFEIAWDTQKMRAAGPHVELVKFFPMKFFTNKAFQPMIQIGGGWNKASGGAIRFEGPIGRAPTLIEEVHAKEVFGKSWLPLVEGHVGFGGFLGEKRNFAWTAGGGVGTLGKSVRGTGTLFF